MKKTGRRSPPTARTLRAVELIVYDFDGVLTDNRVILREDGMESVTVNRSDGLAIGLFKTMGIKQLILSKERNRIVTARARKLKIPCLQGVDDKRRALLRYCRSHGIGLGQVVYVGNDLNDQEPMLAVGHPVCPADACAEIRAISQIVLKTPGGAGVARELLRRIAGPSSKP